jgi:hypothetical protein
MRERDIEGRLAKMVKELGGMCPKFVAPGFDGMPDRIVLMRDGHIGFVEVKTKGKVPRPLQSKRHQQLRALGYKVYVLDDPEDIPLILMDICNPEARVC